MVWGRVTNDVTAEPDVDAAAPATSTHSGQMPLTRRSARRQTQPTSLGSHAPATPAEAGPTGLADAAPAAVTSTVVPAAATTPAASTSSAPAQAPAAAPTSAAVQPPATTPAQAPAAAPTRAAASTSRTPSVPLTASIPIVSDDAKPTADDRDAFAAAARLFSFTGETPIQQSRDDADAAGVEADTLSHRHSKHKAKVRRPGRSRMIAKRAAATSFSFATIIAVGLLAVTSTLPAAAVASPETHLLGAAPQQQAGDVAATGSDDIQAYVAPVDSKAESASLDRSANYSTATMVDMAGTVGISNFSSRIFTNNPQCAVQWPFAVGVPISYGFGPRPGEFHEGVDFTPGSGAHVQSIADGVVRVAQQGYQGYGVAVIIDHEIDGQHWASLYGHMQYGSLQVRPGEHVQVGQYIGRTGNTGFSFGAHTHFEIRQNGVTPIDPIPWLRQHNRC